MTARADSGPGERVGALDPSPRGDRPGGWRRVDRGELARTGFVAACAVVVAIGATWPWERLPLAAVAGLAVGCWPILIEAGRDARRRRMSMELSMLVAILAAAWIGEWVTALIITAFVLAAEILEDLSMDRGRDALTDLMAFLPSIVQVRRGATLADIPLDEVSVGQCVVVPPGGRVPVDGVVSAGQSSVDQSRITGEPLPVELGPGDSVFAGSINQLGALEVRAERVGRQSSYGRIVEAVRRAQSTPAPVQQLADRLASYLVYLALAGATVTWIITHDLTATISVVVVAGACGVAAGTPLAILAAIGRAARNGAFVKGGVHLETLSAVDTVVFDKTGTLTEGRPSVVGIEPAGELAADEVLRLAATAETYSEHPLGRAIVAHAADLGLSVGRPESFVYRPGSGVTAEVDGRRIDVGNITLVSNARDGEATPGSATSVFVAVEGRFAGRILLADTPRESARPCVATLHSLGLRVLMITGDRESAAAQMAARLGIDDVRAGLLPSDKQEAIRSERANGHRLAMVGDGVNDAPALAVADVGIAMGSGTAIARESADVILISSSLDDLTATIAIARRARRVIVFNFAGTIAVDIVGMALAGVGILGPVAAALVHVVSETAFILNSARLAPMRRRGKWPS